MSFPFVQPYFGLGNSLQTAQAAAGGGGGVGGWVELARTTLGSEGDAITISSLPDKRYYQVLVSTLDGTLNSSATLRLGSGSVDSGSNYSYRFSREGGSEDVGTSQPLIGGQVPPNAGNSFDNYFIANKSNKEKLVLGHGTNNEGSGAGTTPRRTEIAGKWTNTSDALDTISIHNDDSGNFGSGSECVVLGWDPADTHTSNFWEELASVSANGSSNTLSASFTSKKYLWVQCYEESSAGSVSFRVGNSTLDTGNNYALRYSSDGGAEDLTTGIDSMDGLTSTTPIFWNYFIINNSASEKLAMCHVGRQNTAGAGTAPKRIESVSKWANTSAQIDTVGFTASDGGATILSNSILKVWGSD